MADTEERLAGQLRVLRHMYLVLQPSAELWATDAALDAYETDKRTTLLGTEDRPDG